MDSEKNDKRGNGGIGGIGTIGIRRYLTEPLPPLLLHTAELTEQTIMVTAKPILASLMTKIILGRSDSSTVEAAPAVADSVVLGAVWSDTAMEAAAGSGAEAGGSVVPPEGGPDSPVPSQEGC